MGGRDALAGLLTVDAARPAVAELVGLLDGGDIALVLGAGGTGAAVARQARSAVALHAGDIGADVLLVHENDDPDRPIVVGVIRGSTRWPLAEMPGGVQLEADGRRLTIKAQEQLSLSCGHARITLTRDGKVLIEGTYVSSRASGVNRVRGGSVHLN